MIRIIYTPDADEFKLPDREMFGLRNPGDPLLQKLRGNYAQLRERDFQDLPEKVGVVSYDMSFRRFSRDNLKEVGDSSTTYLPLAVVDKMLELKSEDMDNPVARSYVDRALDVLMAPLMMSIPPNILGNKLMALGALGAAKGTSNHIKSLERDLQGMGGNSEMLGIIRETIKKIDEVYPDFKDIEEMRERVLERFKLNKVSEDFPLYFLDSRSPPSNYLVGLEDKIEKSGIWESMMGYIKLGCEASGYDEIPEDVQRELDKYDRDVFAQTQRVDSLDAMIKALPEPKTIITDVYIADCFPGLVDRGFEAHEFKLVV